MDFAPMAAVEKFVKFQETLSIQQQFSAKSCPISQNRDG
jgi:hypothetical protein